jgi:hypothetical protein
MYRVVSPSRDSLDSRADALFARGEYHNFDREFYRDRDFEKLDAAVFLAKKISSVPELLPARALKPVRKVDHARSVPGSAPRPPRRKAAAATRKTEPDK